ncbi:MAG: SUF system NifU family Fe-S cluster assembly protein [Spirochaetales bacterium]|nr:SUF system NifU family Fe-S cluster assembly protein [Spirochaetales bacterium]
MSLYKETLMKHFRNPEHKFELENFSKKQDGVNPSCGDNITLYTKINNSIIEDISYTGNGCAISMASADIMCEVLKNRDNGVNISLDFTSMLNGEDINFTNELEVLNVFKEMQNYPARKSCALLPWKTLTTLLNS